MKVEVSLSPVESALAAMALEERAALRRNAEQKFGGRVQSILDTHQVPAGINASLDRAPDGSYVLVYDAPNAVPPSES